MKNFKVIIPNLERRRDRFLFTLGYHIGKNFEGKCIRRHFAHDGACYTDVANLLYDVEYALYSWPYHGNGDYLMKYYEGWTVYDYAWMWTWYDIINAIAREPDNLAPTLVLIDDWYMTYNYADILDHVSILYQMDEPFCMLQYMHGTSEKDCPSQRNNHRTTIPEIQHGIAGTGDPATLISPLGARRLIEFADQNPTHCPEILMYHFSINADNSGCYSSIEDGAVNFTKYIDVFQDRGQISPALR